MIDSKVQTPIDISTVSVSPPAEARPPVNEAEPPVDEIRNAPPPVWLGKMLKWLFPVAAVLFIALIAIPGFLQKWLWMRQLDYAGIFWTLFSVKVGLTCTAFVFALLFLWLNVRQAAKSGMGRADSRTAPADGSAGDPAAQIRLKAIALPSPYRGTGRGADRRGRRRNLCDRHLYAVGHLAALSLWRRLRARRPCLWSGSGLLHVSSAVV